MCSVNASTSTFIFHISSICSMAEPGQGIYGYAIKDFGRVESKSLFYRGFELFVENADD